MKLIRPGPGTVVFAAALALRVGWVVWRWIKTGPTFEFPDEHLHWQLARSLVTDGALVSDDGRYAARMPGYPLFLALCAWLGEAGVLVARLGQALLGAATAWIAYAFASRVLERRAAVFAGVLVCVDPYAIYFSNLLLTEVLFVLLAVALTACAWSVVVSRDRLGRGAALGVACLGAAALMTRPSAAGWVVLLWVVLVALDAQSGRTWSRLALWIAVSAACLSIWGFRNQFVIGAPAWLSTNGGVTLYDAQGPQADGGSNQDFLRELPELRDLTEVQSDRKLRSLAVEQMQKDPGRVLSLARTKFLRTWSLRPNVPEYRGGLTGLVSAVFTACILLLAFIGLGRLLARRGELAPHARRCRRLHLLLWLPVVYFTLLHCVFVGSLRYRVPLMPFLEIAAATALLPRTAKRSALI